MAFGKTLLEEMMTIRDIRGKLGQFDDYSLDLHLVVCLLRLQI